MRRSRSRCSVPASCRRRSWTRTAIVRPSSPTVRTRPRDGEFEQAIRAAVASGMPPSAVADLVFDAIRDERFYVFPHPEVTTLRVRGADGGHPREPHRRPRYRCRAEADRGAVPALVLANPRALQHRGRLHRRASAARPAEARDAVVVDDDARGVAPLSYRGARRARRAASRRCCMRSASRAGDRVLIRLPNCLEYSTAFLGAMKRRRDPRPDLDAAHGRRGRVPGARLGRGRDRDRSGRLGRRSARCSSDSRRCATCCSSAAAPLGGGARARARPRGAARCHRRTSRRRIRRAPRTRRTSSTPPARPATRRACCTRIARCSAASRRRSTGSTSIRAATASCTPASTTGPTSSAPGSWTRSTAGTPPSCARGRSDARGVGRSASPGTARPCSSRCRRSTARSCRRRRAPARDVPTLRHCMSAGEQLPAEVLAEWRARFGLDVYEGLGMTECSYYLCATRSRPIRPGSAGFAQPGHEVTLRDPATWAEVPVDAEGVICIPRDDPGLMLGYWNQPEETARDLPRRVVRDRRSRAPRRRRLHVVPRPQGRPHQHVRLSRLAVRGRARVEGPSRRGRGGGGGRGGGPRQGRGRGVRGRAARRGPHGGRLLAYARAHLASYKAPRIVHLVDDFPRTRNGKVLRRALQPALAQAPRPRA